MTLTLREVAPHAIAGIDQQIADLKTRRAALLAATNGQCDVHQPAPKARVLSADARKRIADAQKKRWAAHRKAQAKGGVL